MSVHEISALQQKSRAPFDSVGMVCKCGKGLATMEGVPVICGGCGTTYIISVMQLKEANPPVQR